MTSFAEMILFLREVRDKAILSELNRVGITDSFLSKSDEEMRASLNFDEREIRVNDRSKNCDSS